MPEKHPAPKSQKAPPTGWETESKFDSIATLEELVNMAPFKEASDSKGGSETIGVRIPSWLARKVMHLLEIRGSPYGLKSDVARDAMYIGLRVLNMRYKSDPDWAIEAKLARVIDDANALSRIKQKTRQFEQSLKEFWDNGDESQAVEYMEHYVAAVVETQDDYQRTKTLQFIRESMFLRNVVDRCNIGVRNAVYGRREKGIA